MIPLKNSFVKIIFKNSIQVEGRVESWSDNICTLRSANNDLLVIQNLTEDVMMFILYEEQKQKSEIIKSLEIEKTKIKDEFTETKESNEPDLSRIKKLADLKVLMNQQDKKIIQEKLRDHTLKGVKATNYGTPNFFQMPGVEPDSAKKDK